MRLRDFPWLSLALAALCGWFGHRVGFDVGRRTERARQTIVAATNDTSARRSAIASRNAVWRTLNGDNLPDSPERRMAHLLMHLLDPKIDTLDSDAKEELRHRGLTAFRRKAEAYLHDDDRARFPTAFREGSAHDVSMALRTLTEDDRRAQALLTAILDDRLRLYAYMDGRRVPLETASDGSAP